MTIVDLQKRKNRRKSKGRAINYPVRVVSAENYINHKGEHIINKENIVIDELDVTLKSLFGCNVLMATTTGCTIEGEPSIGTGPKLEQVLDYVRKMEEFYYNSSFKELEKNNAAGNMLMVAQATSFQRIRYFIESMLEE